MPCRHKSKRQRLAKDTQTTRLRSPLALTSLPFEILAEILLYTCSPPTVLAVSRSCSFLYHSLAQNPSASFIWRDVRETLKPTPLPEPGGDWMMSEADYAAFVFGGGVCEVCGKGTQAMYISFAARIRLCGNWLCRKKFLEPDKFLTDLTDMFLSDSDRHSMSVLHVESNLCFYPSSPITFSWPTNDRIWVRKADLDRCQLDIALNRSFQGGGMPSEETRLVMQRCGKARLRCSVIMEFAARLVRWRCDYDREYKNIKKHNRTWTKTLAEALGWDLEDLLVSQTYGSLLRRKTSLLEKIEMRDVSPIRPVIEAELLAIQAHHKRQDAEATYRGKLAEVKKVYEHMRCGIPAGVHTDTTGPSNPNSVLILPTLKVFCTLPFVRTLKGSPDPSMVPPNGTSSASDIKLTPLTMSLIMSDIHTWLIPVQKHLMGLLGHSGEWQSANTRALPPLKRVTARFFCKRCGEGKVGRKYQREGCLDLKGVCSHVCVARQGKKVDGQSQEAEEESENEVSDGDGDKQEKPKIKGKKKSGAKTPDWKVNIFQKDEKAIRVVKTILDLTGLSEEEPSTVSTLEAKGGVIRCLTCTGWIVMDFATAIGHAHRHESMRVELLSKSTPNDIMMIQKDASAPGAREDGAIFHLSQLGFRPGLTGLLLGPTYRGRKGVDKVDYGCRHCFRVFENNILVGTDNLSPKASKKGPRPMNFNALRSHVKARHGVQEIRDEDFFCYSA